VAIIIATQVKQSAKERVGSADFWGFHGSSIPVNGSGDWIYPVPSGTNRNLSKPAAGYDHQILALDF
jgi:hypothetical protein